MKRSCYYLGSIVVLCLFHSPVAHAGKAQRVTPAPDLTAIQARHAIITAADSLFVPLPGNRYQGSDEQSMWVCLSGVVFDGVADSIDARDAQSAQDHIPICETRVARRQDPDELPNAVVDADEFNPDEGVQNEAFRQNIR